MERDVVHDVATFAQSRLHSPYSLEGLTELEADVLGTVTAMGIIGNGGLIVWFEGMGTEDTLGVASSFERMGLSEVASAMRRALEVFPGGKVIPDFAERRAYLSEHRDELAARFEPLDTAVWNTDYDAVTARYIASRRSDLLVLGPRFGALLDRYDALDRAR